MPTYLIKKTGKYIDYINIPKNLHDSGKIITKWISKGYKLLVAHDKDRAISRFLKGSKCSACFCGDCQKRENYWYCLHFKGMICDICCRYDSTAKDTDYKECVDCEHNKKRI